MKYKGIMFDLDGTLVDTHPDYIQGVITGVTRRLNLSLPESFARKFWYEGNRDELIANNFKINPDIFWAEFRKADNPVARARHTTPYADCLEYLPTLKSRGLKIALLTAATPQICELEASEFLSYVDHKVHTGHGNVACKPDPACIHHCLELLGIKNDQAIMVGNGYEDIQVAKAAGVFDVLVNRGRHTLPDVNPSATIRSLHDLEQYLLSN